MVVHRGAVVAEWGDTSARTPLASVRKSLLSALIGNAVERGEIDLSRPIGALGIDDNEPSLTAEEKSATVRDLLMSRSGIYHAALYETAAMAAQRPRRGSHKPGSFWYYNNWDFNTLGAIYEHAVRSSIFDAFEREIARPIGMQDYRPSDGEYFTGAASVYPAYPIRMSARDLARFALLYLHKGRWQDRQVVPAKWVEESTQAYSRSEFGPGYGYLWWTGPINGGFAPSVEPPQGIFFAQGVGGQYAFVIPGYDLVVVRRGPHAEGGASLQGDRPAVVAPARCRRLSRHRAGCIDRRGMDCARHGRDAPADPSGQDLGLWRNGKPGPLPDQVQCRRQRSRSPGTRADRARHRLLECPRGPALPGLEEARVPVLGRRH